MELDDLKQSWEEANKDSKPLHTNIMELLKNKSYSPLAVLHRKYRMAALMVPLIIVFIAIDMNSVHFNNPTKTIIYGFFLLMMLIICVVAITNYYIIRRLMKNDNLVIENIKKQIGFIEKIIKIQSYLIIGIGVIVFVGSEIMLQRNELHGVFPDFLKTLPIGVRILSYVLFFAIGIYVQKMYQKYPTGIYAHLEHLKDLIKQAK